MVISIMPAIVPTPKMSRYAIAQRGSLRAPAVPPRPSRQVHAPDRLPAVEEIDRARASAADSGRILAASRPLRDRGPDVSASPGYDHEYVRGRCRRAGEDASGPRRRDRIVRDLVA